ncbi:MAG TPA: glycosyltransferase family 2 protein [Chlamydiales bacterium]|nr:glycosyltransferase family 2 protein [Chlamydiales bacterium]
MLRQKIAFFFCILVSFGFADPRPDSLPYISGDTFRCVSDHIFDEDSPSLDPGKVKPGDTIFINLSHIKEFFDRYHPQIQSPYILISFNHDLPAPAEYRSMLEEEKLIAWFTQNPDIAGHPKLFPLPIGISNRHWNHSKNHPETISNTKKSLPQNPEIKYLLYVNFDPLTNPPVRKPIYDYFRAHVPFCTMVSYRPYAQFLCDLAQSKFVLSPHGGGLDCHRTWEAMYMGSFPLVKTSTLDPLYEGLPVLIVNDWTEITPEFLEGKYVEMKGKSYRLEKLYFDYWLKKIRDVQRKYRSPQQKLAEIVGWLEKEQSPIELIQNLLEEVCPQEKRVAALLPRIEKAQLEMNERAKGKETPLLSFVIPCHNRERSVRETINSIYSQNLTLPFEVIAIDDASKDHSFEVLQEYERLHDNFFAFRNPVNLKAPANRNRAVAYARGTYICNADSDDIFEPNTIQPMLQGMIDGGYDVAIFQELRFFEDYRSTNDASSFSRPANSEITLASMLRDNYIGLCAGNRIYTKESWLKSGGCLEAPGHDSWMFSYDFMANGYKGYVHPGSAYRHRTWSDSSNMWYDDLRKNLHDVGPRQVVLEYPELLSPEALSYVENYKPNKDQFMSSIQGRVRSGQFLLSVQAERLLDARYQENKGRNAAALKSYCEALELQPELPLSVYLRAARAALRLEQKSDALKLLQKVNL